MFKSRRMSCVGHCEEMRNELIVVRKPEAEIPLVRCRCQRIILKMILKQCMTV
jgi:hypothetical protein